MLSEFVDNYQIVIARSEEVSLAGLGLAEKATSEFRKCSTLINPLLSLEGQGGIVHFEKLSSSSSLLFTPMYEFNDPANQMN